MGLRQERVQLPEHDREGVLSSIGGPKAFLSQSIMINGSVFCFTRELLSSRPIAEYG